jgi:hypothetical protein
MEKGIANVSTSNAYLRNEIALEQGKNYNKKIPDTTAKVRLE